MWYFLKHGIISNFAYRLNLWTIVISIYHPESKLMNYLIFFTLFIFHRNAIIGQNLEVAVDKTVVHSHTWCGVCKLIKTNKGIQLVHVTFYSLQWRHNERDGVSNRRPFHCLLNGWYWRRLKKTSKLLVTGLCAGITRTKGQRRGKYFHLMTSSRYNWPYYQL